MAMSYAQNAAAGAWAGSGGCFSTMTLGCGGRKHKGQGGMEAAGYGHALCSGQDCWCMDSKVPGRGNG